MAQATKLPFIRRLFSGDSALSGAGSSASHGSKKSPVGAVGPFWGPYFISGFILLKLHYFDALAGAGKTYALVREADRLARRGGKVLFVQPTCNLIEQTLRDELLALSPSYPAQALHGECVTGVTSRIVQHFRSAQPGGEVLFITHAAFFAVGYLENKANWHLLFDEVPAVDHYGELVLPETHDLLTVMSKRWPWERSTAACRW